MQLYIWNMELLNLNGKIVSTTSGLISPNSRGFRYGDGVFETMICRENLIHFADDHINRLINGLTVLDFAVPTNYTTAYFTGQINDLLKENEHNKTARIRLTAFRDEGSLYDETNEIPNFIIQTWALQDSIGKWNEKGLVLGICTYIKKSCDSLCNLKHNNFLPYVMGANLAKRNNWNDAVMLNCYGRVCDTTIANIFLIKNKMVYTPALQEGCVAGVIRKNLIGHLINNNIEVIEKELTIEDLMQADELFVTNSIHNIQWVQNIAGKKYSNNLTRSIYESFTALPVY